MRKFVVIVMMTVLLGCLVESDKIGQEQNKTLSPLKAQQSLKNQSREVGDHDQKQKKVQVLGSQSQKQTDQDKETPDSKQKVEVKAVKKTTDDQYGIDQKLISKLTQKDQDKIINKHQQNDSTVAVEKQNRTNITKNNHDVVSTNEDVTKQKVLIQNNQSNTHKDISKSNNEESNFFDSKEVRRVNKSNVANKTDTDAKSKLNNEKDQQNDVSADKENKQIQIPKDKQNEKNKTLEIQKVVSNQKEGNESIKETQKPATIESKKQEKVQETHEQILTTNKQIDNSTISHLSNLTSKTENQNKQTKTDDSKQSSKHNTTSLNQTSEESNKASKVEQPTDLIKNNETINQKTQNVTDKNDQKIKQTKIELVDDNKTNLSSKNIEKPKENQTSKESTKTKKIENTTKLNKNDQTKSQIPQNIAIKDDKQSKQLIADDVISSSQKLVSKGINNDSSINISPIEAKQNGTLQQLKDLKVKKQKIDNSKMLSEATNNHKNLSLQKNTKKTQSQEVNKKEETHRSTKLEVKQISDKLDEKDKAKNVKLNQSNLNLNDVGDSDSQVTQVSEQTDTQNKNNQEIIQHKKVDISSIKTNKNVEEKIKDQTQKKGSSKTIQKTKTKVNEKMVIDSNVKSQVYSNVKENNASKDVNKKLTNQTFSNNPSPSDTTNLDSTVSFKKQKTQKQLHIVNNTDETEIKSNSKNVDTINQSPSTETTENNTTKTTSSHQKYETNPKYAQKSTQTNQKQNINTHEINTTSSIVTEQTPINKTLKVDNKNDQTNKANNPEQSESKQKLINEIQYKKIGESKLKKNQDGTYRAETDDIPDKQASLVDKSNDQSGEKQQHGKISSTQGPKVNYDKSPPNQFDTNKFLNPKDPIKQQTSTQGQIQGSTENKCVNTKCEQNLNKVDKNDNQKYPKQDINQEASIVNPLQKPTSNQPKPFQDPESKQKNLDKSNPSTVHDQFVPPPITVQPKTTNPNSQQYPQDLNPIPSPEQNNIFVDNEYPKKGVVISAETSKQISNQENKDPWKYQNLDNQKGADLNDRGVKGTLTSAVKSEHQQSTKSQTSSTSTVQHSQSKNSDPKPDQSSGFLSSVDGILKDNLGQEAYLILIFAAAIFILIAYIYSKKCLTDQGANHPGFFRARSEQFQDYRGSPI